MSISTNLSPTNPGVAHRPLGGSAPAAPAGGTLTKADFDYVASLVREHAAIEIGPDKEYLVEQRITAVARAEAHPSIAALLQVARREPGNRIIKLLVDAMTTNETSFFRDPTVYEFLRAEILPELIERNRSTRRLRIWCAAASSGQEPYSVAMLLREHFPEIVAGWQIRLFATDISTTMIERTRKGTFSRIEVNRGLPATLLVKHFEREKLDWVVSSELRNSIELREVNLAQPLPFTDQFDLVMLRNVLIYFSVETKRAVLGRVRKALAPGGVLFLGATESTMHVDDTWDRRVYGNASCFQADSHATLG